MSIKNITQKLNYLWLRTKQTVQSKLRPIAGLRPPSFRVFESAIGMKRLKGGKRLYQVLGMIHHALITDAGLLILVFGFLMFRPYFNNLREISLAFFVLYIVCDLIRLSFLRGATISLGFPLIFLTLLADSPFIAMLPAALGSLISETIQSVWISKQRLSWFPALRRTLFYVGHHAVAGLGALVVYQFIYIHYPSMILPTLLHLEAILAYVAIYSLISMLLIWPHDLQLRLFLLTPDEEPFVRIDFFTTLLLLPLPAAVFYLFNLSSLGQIEKILVVFGILPPLFIFLFYLARNFTRTEDERMRLDLREQVSERLGSPANLAEMVERILTIMGDLMNYQWGAIYSHTNGELELCGTKLAKHAVIFRNPYQPKAEISPLDETSKKDTGKVTWPLQVKLGEGVLGKLDKANLLPQFFDGALNPASPLDPYLPPKTALMIFPITVTPPGEEGKESLPIIGLVALARPRRLFTTWDWEKGQALSDKASNVFLSVQRLERTIQDLYQKVADYATDPEKVRQAMQELIRQKVDVAKILAVVSEHSFHGSLRAVLAGVVEKQQNQDISLPPERLTEIYQQVRDETPGMPLLNSTILQLLQTVTSSLSLAFSFQYQFPNVERGPAFREFYDFLLEALDANTVTKIAELDRQIEATTEVVHKREGTSREQAKLPLEVLEEFIHLQRITRQLAKFTEAHETAEQRAILEYALELHNECGREITERLRDPERFVLLQILSSWQTAMLKALENLARGPAHLSLSFRNHQALPLPEIAVGLVLRNEGPGIASNVVVQLQPSANYEPLKGKADLGTLNAGKTVEFELSLHPFDQDSIRLHLLVTYHDPERKGKTEEFADLLHLRESPANFSEIANPYTPGTPLKPGNSTFFGRTDIFNYIQRRTLTLAGKTILVLVGERRTGKTSILQQLPVHLKNPCIIPIYINGQAIGIDEGLGNFFLSLADSLADGLQAIGFSVPRLTPANLSESPQYVFERHFLPAVREQIGERNLLLTIDEFEELGDRVRRGRLPPEIFSYLRHLMQDGEQLNFILAGTHQIEELNEEYWAKLFNIAEYKKVSFLNREETVRLITEPVQPYGMVYDDLAITEILHLTACHPYFTQMLCSILVDRCNEAQRSYVTVQDVRDTIDDLLDKGRAHLFFLWQTSTPEAKLILAALVELQGRLEQVSTIAIADRLRDFEVDLNSHQILKTMEQLVNRDLIRETSGDPVYYDFTAQLYAHWLRRYQPLSKVVEEVSIESVAA